jgi:hypothetical protein
MYFDCNKKEQSVYYFTKPSGFAFFYKKTIMMRGINFEIRIQKSFF